MLSYRHSYHAGNFADLLKHATLVYLIDYLNKKEKPYFYLDTHSGAGLYDLSSAAAEKTGECFDGILKFIQTPTQTPCLLRFQELVQHMNRQPKQPVYPGSPYLASLLTRSTERLVFNELHPTDHGYLTDLFRHDKRCQVRQADGFGQMKATLPPKEKRGLILIDPSYEKKQDYEQLIQAISIAYKRFATGVYAIWYPVINRQETEAWIQKIRATGIPKLIRVEHCPYPDTSGLGMTGSGMLIINPPYTLKEDFSDLLSELDQKLRPGKPGKTLVDYLS